MKKYVLLFLFCCLIFLPRSAAQGQAPTSDGLIRLQAAVFDPLVNLQAASDPMAGVQAAGVDAPASPYYLVQFTGSVQAVWTQQIAALGGQVLGYVPDNAHVVRMEPTQLEKISRLPSVRWIGPYWPGYKWAPELAARFNELATNSNLIEVYVLAFAGEPASVVETFLRAQGATIQSMAEPASGPVFRITTPAHSLAAITQNPAVSWVERYREPTLLNDEARKIMGAEAVWQDLGYRGEGQIIAISDSGLSVQGALSSDFNGRLLRAFAPSEMNIAQNCRAKTTWTDLNGHGTHVAGSVLGNGVLSGSNPATHLYTNSRAGLAPEAKLVFMALNTDGSTGIQCIDENGDFIAKGYVEGARISTNSWGANDAGAYGFLSSLVDDYLWRHKDYLVLFAAGNAGPGAQTIGSPGTAKNILTVGASENNRADQGADGDNPNDMADFSSRGPTKDGRIKPEVVAPGTWILSVRAAQAPDGSFWAPFDANYAFMGGTSMATPLTAGGAALVREWLAEARNITTPSGALMKAILINGATQLPGATIPNNENGHGRVDLKNTLRAQYAIMDDHVQGLTNGQSVSYTVQIVGTTAVGTVIASDNPGLPSAAIQAAAAASMQLIDNPPLVTTQTITNPTELSVEALPGHAVARPMTPIPSSAATDKRQISVLANAVPTVVLTATQLISGQVSPNFQPRGAGQTPGVNSYLFNMVGGGDFEDPAWTDDWQYVWLGSGAPLRTSDPNYVINGEYSMWLGGTALDDAIYYPVQFPDQIDTSTASFIEFNILVADQDLDEEGNPFDQFCVALIDASDYFIGPYAPDQPECVYVDGDYTYKLEFTAADLQALAGETGYLVLYNVTDGAEPHLSAFVDDVVLAIDFPAIELAITPASGPPGTTFLLTGQYNVPYSAIDVCISPCSFNNYIKTVYADARGAVAAFLYSTTSIVPGTYPIQTVDVAGRTGESALTIVGEDAASLTVTPTSGPAGTKFAFSGSRFLPNDNSINLTVNGESFGTVSSNANGEVAFEIATTTNIPADDYVAQLTDSAGRTADATFSVTAPATGDPTLSVTPASGPPGTAFVFEAQNFTPDTAANVVLDGQVLGQVTLDATGSTQLTLETANDVAPGAYTLAIVQGEKQASAQYTVTSGGDAPQSGTGLYLALTWTDPPAQTSAAQTLVNDLDLTVDGPNGRVLGNGGATANRNDNVETIRLEDPAPGNYVITVAAHSVNATFGAQPYALVATTKQNASANTNNVGIGNSAVGSLSGVIFVDLNRNGLRDTGEPGLAGARVTITQPNTTISVQATTDSNGAYAVNNLAVGNYTVTITLPASYGLTTVGSTTVSVGTTGTVVPNIGTIVQIYLPLVGS